MDLNERKNLTLTEIKIRGIENRIQILYNRDSEANANIINKLERQLRRLREKQQEE